MQRIKHNAVKRLREQSKKVAPDINLDDLEPVVASYDGYVLTKDGRVLCQFQTGEQPILGNMLRMLTWVSDHMNPDHVLKSKMETGALVEIINGMDEFPRGSDVKGVTKEETFAMMSRMVAIPDLETACLDLQLGTSKMRKLLLELQEVGRARQPIPERLVIEITMLLRDTE